MVKMCRNGRDIPFIFENERLENNILNMHP